MKKFVGIGVAALVLLLALPRAKADICGAHAGNLVSNCGFETGFFTSWTLTGNDVPGEQGNLYGTEGSDGGINPNSGAFQAYFGDLAANPTTLAQTLATTVGASYAISFYLAEELEGPGTVTNSAVVSFGGTTLETLTNVGAGGYTLYTVTGVASSGSTVLNLTFGDDIGEFLLDDVSVTAVPTPEPGSWVLAATGVLLLGWLSRSALKQPLTGWQHTR